MRTTSISGGNTGCGCCSRATTSRSSYGRPGSGVKAVYLRTMGLEMDSMQLVALIRRMKEADVPGRIELLNGCLLK